MSAYHIPVLLPEVLAALEVQAGGCYVDATLGGGGYSEAILGSAPKVQVLGFDTDPAAHLVATERLASFGALFRLVPENFGHMAEALAERGVEAVDGIVYDLGVSSHQLDTTSIGLSYRHESPLDMRLDPRLAVSALEIIGTWDAIELKRIFRAYGEEPYAGPIARKIVEARTREPIMTTTALAAVITEGLRADKRNETLSRVFQALRIEVNQELDMLERSLQQAIELLKPGGRIVVVSYHSLEDRIVKECFRRESAPTYEAGSLGSLKGSIDPDRIRLELVTRKPVIPEESEILRNPRARSAKLRAAVRTNVR